MRAEVINFVKVLCDVTDYIYIKTRQGIFAIREEDGHLYIRKGIEAQEIIWCSERQTLSIEDMERIISYHRMCKLNSVDLTEEDDNFISKLSKALEHRKSLNSPTQ